jgi:RNA polymerase sporulation-specific sigma factor
MIIESLSLFLRKIMFFTAYVNNTSSFPKPLNSKEEAEYLEKFQNGDMKAKEILIHHNLRLVAHIVKKYSGTEEADDLISAGSLGLIKAINTYKLGHNTQFSTYAARCIENEILMLLRVNKKHKGNISIEEALGTDMDDNEMSIIDLIESPDADVEVLANNMIISNKLEKILKSSLSKREYTIMSLRYGLNGNPALTQREVSKYLNISRSYVSRLEKKSIETLQKIVKKEDYR